LLGYHLKVILILLRIFSLQQDFLLHLKMLRIDNTKMKFFGILRKWVFRKWNGRKIYFI